MDEEPDCAAECDSDETNPIAYGIGSYDSNGMKSPNPISGFYEAYTSRTLDNNGGNPACNQGGMAIVQHETYQKTTGSLCASGYDKLGTQEAMNDMYVLDYSNAEQRGVCYGLDRASFNQGKGALYDFTVDEELSPPLVARGPGGVINGNE